MGCSGFLRKVRPATAKPFKDNSDPAAHWQNNGQAPWSFPPTFADLEAQLAAYREATASLAAAYEATIIRQAEEIARLEKLLKDLCGVEVLR